MAKSEELQRQTMRVLSELGSQGSPLSARAAGAKLEIGYNQISDMVQGKPPAEKTLIKFASAIGENAADWLRYAGKHEFANTMAAPDALPRTEEQRFAAKIALELSHVPKERQALLMRQIRAFIRATQEDTGRK